MPVRAVEFLDLPIDAQVKELATLVDNLSLEYTRLSQSQVQAKAVYFRGYSASHETSHAARDVSGNRESLPFIAEIMESEAKIKSLETLIQFYRFVINA